MKKRILCYGDSNTYGFNPYNCSRYTENQRWSGILKKKLSGKYEVIEEGKNNRTGIADNPDGFEYSAQKHFPNYISNVGKIDILILAIGSNDLQYKFNLSLKDIEQGLEILIKTARNYDIDKIILVTPVKIGKNILNGYFKCQFDETSIQKSQKINDVYKKLAEKYDCKYFDFYDFVSPSDVDGLHYDISSHAIIANKLEEIIISYMSE